MSVQEEINAMMKKIEQAKKELATLDGREAEIKKTLKTNFGVDTIEDAENLIANMDVLIEELENSLNEKMKELSERYQW